MYIQKIRLFSIMILLPLLFLSYMCYDYGSILHPSRYPTDPKKEIYFSLFLAVLGHDKKCSKVQSGDISLEHVLYIVYFVLILELTNHARIDILSELLGFLL